MTEIITWTLPILYISSLAYGVNTVGYAFITDELSDYHTHVVIAIALLICFNFFFYYVSLPPLIHFLENN